MISERPWSGGVHAAEGDRRVMGTHGGLEAAAPAVAQGFLGRISRTGTDVAPTQAASAVTAVSPRSCAKAKTGPIAEREAARSGRAPQLAAEASLGLGERDDFDFRLAEYLLQRLIAELEFNPRVWS